MRPTVLALLSPIIVPVTLYCGYLLTRYYCEPENRWIPIDIITAMYLSGIVVTIWEVVAVSRASLQILRNPSLRSKVNIGAIGIAISYIVVFCIYFAKVTRFG